MAKKLTILVIDGQGGGLGRSIIEKIKAELPDSSVIAIGTNSAATTNMLKASPDSSATGESAIYYNAGAVDFIVGPIGIVAASSLMGEISERMAAAIGQSKATKVLIPINKCNLQVVGKPDYPMGKFIDMAVEMLKKWEG